MRNSIGQKRLSFWEHTFAFIGRKTRFLQPSFVQFGAQYPPREWNLAKNRTRSALPNDTPRISIVIPSYKQAAYLEKTITSLLSQDYPALELIVVDGGSDDGSKEIIEKYSAHIKWWCSEQDSGQTNALNRGFAQSSGEIMAWLNSDDMLMPETLNRVAAYFAHYQNVDAVYGHRILIDEEDRDIGRWIVPKHDDKVMTWADFIPQETLFWRRSLWQKAGKKLDESFKFAMDWDLLLRFRDAGARFVRLPYFLGLFRVHAGQKTSAQINDVGFAEMQRLRKRCLGYTPHLGRKRFGEDNYLKQYRVALGTAFYLLKARVCELLWKAGLIKYD